MNDKLCSIEECDLVAKCRNLCTKHYQQFLNSGAFSDDRRSGGRPPRVLPEGLRWCSYHQNPHPVSDFRSNERTCRLGCYFYHINLVYNLSEEEYNSMIGLCPICQLREVKYVDHDHLCCPGQKSCGACVRGMLCPPCNTALAAFGDDPVVFLRAIDYLNNNRSAGIVRNQDG